MEKLYLAAPLFSKAELTFNQKVNDKLKSFFDVYLPQNDGLLMEELVEDNVTPDIAGKHILKEDKKAIKESDVLLAVLDGRSVDEGVAFEIGYAYALNTPCYGLQTDPRRLLPVGNNPMIQNSLINIFGNYQELLDWASKRGTKTTTKKK